jgi:alkylation response protein AidB-like acyl-CoA dehydrogenase
MYALVRTNKAVPKRQGISFVLIDMNAPGVTRRPILTVADDEEFCEVFFDNLRVPLRNVVGEID